MIPPLIFLNATQFIAHIPQLLLIRWIVNLLTISSPPGRAIRRRRLRLPNVFEIDPAPIRQIPSNSSPDRGRRSLLDTLDLRSIFGISRGTLIKLRVLNMALQRRLNTSRMQTEGPQIPIFVPPIEFVSKVDIRQLRACVRMTGTVFAPREIQVIERQSWTVSMRCGREGDHS